MTLIIGALLQKYRMNRKRKDAFQLTQVIESPLDLYEHLPFQVAVVSNLLQLNRDFVIRDILDLDPRELRVILNIGSYMPIKAADIAYQARLDSYTISRAVKKLKSLGMVRSSRLDNDQKAKYLQLTDAGIEVYRRLQVAIEKRTKFLEQAISIGEKQQLMGLLAKLEDQAEMLLAQQALQSVEAGNTLPADQKEIVRWAKKSSDN